MSKKISNKNMQHAHNKHVWVHTKKTNTRRAGEWAKGEGGEEAEQLVVCN